MFDNVGRDLDEEQGRRQAAASLISVGGIATIAFVAAALTYVAVEPPVVEEVEEWHVVDLMEPVEEDELEVPKVPALAAISKGTVAPEEAEPPDPEPDPEATPESLKPMEPSEPVVDQAPDVGIADGSDNGRADGDKLGTGRSPDGALGGTGEGTRQPKTVHHTELEVKRLVTPEYPREAKALSIGEVRCLVDLSIDERGVPTRAVVRACPEVFHEEARSAMLKSRWYPVKEGKQRIGAATTYSIRFVLR